MKKNVFTLLLAFAVSLLMAQNHSLHFDGDDDFVEITSKPELTPNQFTIEAWVKSNEQGTSQPIFTKYNTNIGKISYIILFIDSNKFRFVVYEDYNQGAAILRAIDSDNPVLNVNEWQHFAVTFDLSSQEMKLYMNGVEVEASITPESTTINSIFNGDQPVRIGRAVSVDGSSSFFNGNIDEVRFWNVVRTQAEIQANMNTELTGTEAGLVSYYKMDIPDTPCNVIDCNSFENHGARGGVSNANNLPQYSTDAAPVADVDCGVMLSCLPVSVESVDADEQIQIYPNPSNDMIEIMGIDTGEITIFDSFGKIVKNLNYTNPQIDVSHLPSGLYLLQIHSNDNLFIRKIIVE